MKNLMITTAVLSLAIILTGCGGGAESSVSGNNPPPTDNITPSETTPSYDLIINNGRGTTNNQDTERSDTANVQSPNN